jgi:UTP--glucose-1-phosphate uridylyltransferase
LFSYLKEVKPGKNGEIQLTDGMNHLAKNNGLLASRFKSKRYDAGDKLGFLIANIEVGLNHPEIGPSFKEYLKSLTRELK